MADFDTVLSILASLTSLEIDVDSHVGVEHQYLRHNFSSWNILSFLPLKSAKH